MHHRHEFVLHSLRHVEPMEVCNDCCLGVYRSMFEHVATLGTGAFGEVDLVRKRDSGVLFALKTLRKRDVLQRNQVAHVKAERDILAEADNEWVVKLYYSFQVGLTISALLIPGEIDNECITYSRLDGQ